MKLCSTIIAAAALLAGAPFSPHAQVITFDELPTQPVHGLSLEGVTFDFRVGGVPTNSAIFNITTGPGATPFNTPPNLEGPVEGILTLDFAVPTTLLRFGSHVGVNMDLPIGLTVQLYDSALMPLGAPIALPMTMSPIFAGGLFDYSGGAVTRAVIDFNNEATPMGTRFTLDDLTFTPVPEPSTVWLTLVGLAAVIFIAGRSSKFRPPLPAAPPPPWARSPPALR